MAEYIYTLRKARRKHGDKLVLDDVTLSFLPGAKIGVVGPNGAGKSSVLKIMAGLDQPSNGEARLTPGYSVGILMQEPELNEEKTVLGNVEEGAGEIKAKLDRYNEIGAAIEDDDLDDLEALFGHRPESWLEGEAELERFVLADAEVGEHDDELIPLLHKRNLRAQLLNGPPGSAIARHNKIQSFRR